jgi:hypothetical protein
MVKSINMKYLLIFFLSFFIIKNSATAQNNFGTLEGKLTDKETGEGLIAASILLYKTGEKTPITGASTDINGNYSINNIPVGVYDVEFSYVCYTRKTIKKVQVFSKVKRLDYSLKEHESDCTTEVVTTHLNIPLISCDDFGTGRTYKASDIQNMPTKW